jgi:hypothetical protein
MNFLGTWTFSYKVTALFFPIQGHHSTSLNCGKKEGYRYLFIEACWMPGIAPKHLTYLVAFCLLNYPGEISFYSPGFTDKPTQA